MFGAAYANRRGTFRDHVLVFGSVAIRGNVGCILVGLKWKGKSRLVKRKSHPVKRKSRLVTRKSHPVKRKSRLVTRKSHLSRGAWSCGLSGGCHQGGRPGRSTWRGYIASRSCRHPPRSCPSDCLPWPPVNRKSRKGTSRPVKRKSRLLKRKSRPLKSKSVRGLQQVGLLGALDAVPRVKLMVQATSKMTKGAPLPAQLSDWASTCRNKSQRLSRLANAYRLHPDVGLYPAGPSDCCSTTFRPGGNRRRNTACSTGSGTTHIAEGAEAPLCAEAPLHVEAAHGAQTSTPRPCTSTCPNSPVGKISQKC